MVRPGGEIGRRTGLKIPGPLKACRFDSGPGHHQMSLSVWFARGKRRPPIREKHLPQEGPLVPGDLAPPLRVKDDGV